MTQERTVGIDIFSGAGGMTLGARQAGIEVLYAVDSCPHATATYQRNFPTISVFEGDIRTLKALPPRPDQARTIIFGGPPCQGFSTSNQRTRTLDNADNWLYREFARIVEMWRPDWVVMENVRGILETASGVFFRSAVDTLEALGYSTCSRVLNAAHFAVPQNRSRAFIVGSISEQISFPTPTTTKAISVQSAIDDLPELKPGATIDVLPYRKQAETEYAEKLRMGKATVSGNLVTQNAPYVIERYSHVPKGGNWEDIPPRLLANYRNPKRCHTGIYKRLDPDKPSVVIGNFRKNMLIHPTEDRGLSIREAARIQSIPDHFVFEGSIGFQQQQVGNLVPPRLAKAVFREICGA